MELVSPPHETPKRIKQEYGRAVSPGVSGEELTSSKLKAPSYDEAGTCGISLIPYPPIPSDNERNPKK